MPELTFRSRQILAFAAVYVIWGSTYLAIRLLIDTLPGFSMVGLRFLLAGIILYAVARWRGAAAPTGAQWRNAACIGGLLLFVGTGAVVWASYHIESGLAALMVGTEPLWMALMLWLWPFGKAAGRRPDSRSFGALVIGFLGAAILAAPGAVVEGASIHLPSLLAITLGCIAWAAGSLAARQVELPTSPWINTACQMLAGGALLMIYGLASNEWAQFDIETVSWTSALAFFYLVIFGSLVAFSAYSWLIQTTEPTLVATHAYVNPVVAVFLGWLIADEHVGLRTILASGLIIGSVVLLTSSERRARRLAAEAPPKPVQDGATCGLTEPTAEIPAPEQPVGGGGERAAEDIIKECAIKECA